MALPQQFTELQQYFMVPTSQSSTPTPAPSTIPSSTNPQLARSNYATSSSSSSDSPPERMRRLGQRASLEIHGNLQDMALGWSHDEWRNGRRLVQFWRKQEGASIQAICKPILPEQYVPNSIVISCIFWSVTNECYVTSVDIIYLLEALVATRFNVEEKNRIRRNLEGLKPKTISKVGKSNDRRVSQVQEEFFKQVMSFPNPRPRHIEKDIKIFPWRSLQMALNKIIGKYSTIPNDSLSSPNSDASLRSPNGPQTSPQQQMQSQLLQQQQQHQQQQQPHPMHYQQTAQPYPLHRRYASDMEANQQSMQRQQANQPYPGHQRFGSDFEAAHMQSIQRPQPPPPSQTMMPQQRYKMEDEKGSFGRYKIESENGSLGRPLGLQRSNNPSLNIDVAASNSHYHPGGQSYSTSSYQPIIGNNSSSLQHTLAPGMNNLPSHSQPSPRKTPLSGSQPHFNFNDFVVSPVAFGQTPLQQSQQQAQNTLQPWQYGSGSLAQAQSNTSGYGSLGMDLGPRSGQ